MLKKSFLALSFPLLLGATTLPELFDALKNHSQTKADAMRIEQAKVAQSMAESKLYPTINLFAKYDHYTTATGMLPVPPNILFKMIDKNNPAAITQPFSQNIMREGASFTMPLFVKAIYTMADKAQQMQQSAKAKKEINILKNEALIVGANANFLYLQALEKSLGTKEKSLLETQKTIQIKVDTGRAPESALYKIEDGLNQKKIKKNNIALKKEQIINSIRAITGITLQKPIDMQPAQPLQTSQEIAALKPLRLKIAATQLDIDAQKEKLYPTVAAYGNYAFSQASAYNNDKSANEKYGNIGIVLQIPLLAMDRYEGIERAKVTIASENAELQKLEDELSSKAKMLQNSLPLLENSIKLSQKSIKNKEKLLKIAKVNYTSGRLSTEEYLRYEDDLVGAHAKLHKTEAQKWQTLMQLAVIYANNIEEMVR